MWRTLGLTGDKLMGEIFVPIWPRKELEDRRILQAALFLSVYARAMTSPPEKSTCWLPGDTEQAAYALTGIKIWD